MKGQTHRSPNDLAFRRGLREKATDAERCLWRRLRGGQIANARFRRQHPFEGYVLDFVCLDKHLVVEVDGGQHLESKRDRVRDNLLAAAGFRVLRFWNTQVLTETDAVVEAIWRAVEASDPSPAHPPP